MSDSEVRQICKQAQACVRKRQYDEAIVLFQKAASLDDMDADVYEGLATANFMVGKLEDARDGFKRVTRLDPRRGRAWVNLGAVFNRMKDFKSAAEALRKGVQKERKSAQAYYNLGIAQRGLNQTAMAISAYKEAIRIQPDFVEAHQNLGNAYLEMNSNSQAVRSFNRALELRPDFERAKRGLAKAKAATSTAKANFSPFGRLVDEKTIGDQKATEYRELNDQQRFDDRHLVREICTIARDETLSTIDIMHEQLQKSLEGISHALLQSDGDALEANWKQLVSARNQLKEERLTIFENMQKLRAHEQDMIAQ